MSRNKSESKSSVKDREYTLRDGDRENRANEASEEVREAREARGNQSDSLRASPMMAHLLDALEKGEDVGHYGRLTFAMVARHFMNEGELVRLLAKQPDQDEAQARSMVQQVIARDYNPPKRERILEWQAKQDFAICPTPDEPGTCNVYSELRFPEGIYDNIGEFYEEQAEADNR